MTPSLPDVKSIFGRALEIEAPDRRAAYLDEVCGPDDGLRAEVEGLLAALGRAGGFMHRPAAAVAAEITASYEPLTEGPGTRIGPYKLLQQIGEGGMGVVYMAEQEEPIRRKVALKIIKPGMDSRQVVARFEAERQALAMMDHTNIAKVFDAGTTDTGRPYFVMELVHGVAITTYCDANQLTPRERLELFLPVCHAILHAHQKGVIHRDIKPSNVLVTMYDKLARRNRVALTTAALVAAALVLGTAVSVWQAVQANTERDRARAAVEQALAEKNNTRSALDFIQYSLLAQANPEREPDRDLKLRTALDRAARELKSRPPGAPLADASIHLVLGDTYLALGESEKAQQLLERAWETRQRELGAEHADTVQAMTLVGVAYSKNRSRVAEAERLLLKALVISRRTQGEEHADTLRVMYELGMFHAKEGAPAVTASSEDWRLASKHRYTQAAELLETVLQVRLRALGEAQPETLRTMNALAYLYNAQGRVLVEREKLEQSEAMARRSLEVARRLLEVEHPLTLGAMNMLANSYWQMGRFAQAERLNHEALGIGRRVFGGENPFTLDIKRNLTGLYLDQGKYVEAELLCVEVLESDRRRPDVSALLLAVDCARLGYIRLKHGEWDQAKRLLDESVTLFGQTDFWPRFHVEVLLGECLLGQQKYAEAEPLLRDGYLGLKQREADILAISKWRLTEGLERLVQLYEEWGKPDEAAKWRKELNAEKEAEKKR